MKARQLLLGLLFSGNLALSSLATSHSVYLGVEGYGNASSSNKANFNHKFYVDDQVETYKIASDASFSLENQLALGYLFDLEVEHQQITALTEVQALAEGWVDAISEDSIVINGDTYPLSPDYQGYIIRNSTGSSSVATDPVMVGDSVKIYGNPVTHIFETFLPTNLPLPVTGTAGERTIKNFLATAMMPVGTSLYVYGGLWDWQDKGSSALATTIGLPSKVTDFFQSQDVNYQYKTATASTSYFPYQGWNQYYYAGMDCSGYVGWAVYNTLHQESGGTGYVTGASRQGRNLADQYDYGTWSKSKDLKVGDIFSMDGHVWIYLGACQDGSFVILHSTPSNSLSGGSGGGVQLTGVGNSPSCQGAMLAKEYMETYFPQWSERYPTVYKSYASYTSMTETNAGKFTWHLSSDGLLDIDGYRQLSAEEILADLFSTPTGAIYTTRGESISYLWQAMSRPSPSSTVDFADVGENLVEAVSWASEQGITSGTGEGLFSPDRPVTRGEFLTYLWAMVGRPTVEKDNPFEDVPEGAYYTQALLWAVAEGITSGTTATTFSPDQTVTREQIVLFLRQVTSKT